MNFPGGNPLLERKIYLSEKQAVRPVFNSVDKT